MNGYAKFDDGAYGGQRGERKRRRGVKGEERAQKMGVLRGKDASVCHYGDLRIHSEPHIGPKQEKSTEISLNASCT